METMINIEELNKMTFEEAEAAVEAAGYLNKDSNESDCNTNEADKIGDSYYFLYSEDDELIDKIAGVQLYNVIGTNQDFTFDIVRSYWERLDLDD